MYKLFLSVLIISSILAGCKKGRLWADEDIDSDRPAWAGGNTEDNIHRKGNDQSGISKGSDYGDLYVLLRDMDGVPAMRLIGDQWYVQPIKLDGTPLELNEEGEVVDPTQATEVEFGRMNIVRSPQSVLDHAFEEAMKTIGNPDALISLDFCGRLTATYEEFGEKFSKTIDSPRENLAIYQYLMKYLFEPLPDGSENRLAFLGEDPYNFDPLQVAASCLAAGSDKFGTIILDEVIYINGFIEAWGPNPIVNEHEYDAKGEVKKYFNFSNYQGDGIVYQYNRRATYENRYIQFQVWENTYYPIDEYGNCEGPVFSILDYFEDYGQFTYAWGAVDETKASGFALAVDDAVQVLEFVHEDSNIRYLPDYIP